MDLLTFAAFGAVCGIAFIVIGIIALAILARKYDQEPGE